MYVLLNTYVSCIKLREWQFLWNAFFIVAPHILLTFTVSSLFRIPYPVFSKITQAFAYIQTYANDKFIDTALCLLLVKTQS